jgi:SAM-dependent methyltransferase
MRLGAIGENPIERIIAKTNIPPMPIIETQIAFSMARTIMAGVKLGIFDSIGRGQATPSEVAEACKTDVDATTKLLNTLVGLRYLTHRNGRYGLTPKASKWLLSDSPNSISDKLLFQYDEWDLVGRYEDYITTGQPIEFHGESTDSGGWDRYQRGMRSLGSISGDEVAARMPVPAGATSMLDIGGSHGYFSVCVCRRHSNLSSTVLDLAEAVEHAAPILARERMGDRVSHRAGDALSDDLGQSVWDIVLISQLVHHFNEEQNRSLVRRVAGSLKPGGVCILLDMLRPSSPEGAGGIAAVLDLYFSATSRSGTWPLDILRSWESDAGLKPDKTIHLRTMPGAAMVVGRKAG